MTISWPLWIYVLIITTLFAVYAQGVRKGKLSGNAIVRAGAAIGGVALLGMLFLLGQKPQPVALLINVIMMSLCTAYCIVMAQKQARVEEIVSQGKLAVTVASAYRLPHTDVLIVPTSTHLRSLGGPSGMLLAAGGKLLEKEIATVGSINQDKVLFTGAGSLNTNKLLHAAVFTPEDMRVDGNRVKKGLQAALLLARKDNAKTVGLAYAPLRGISAVDAVKLYWDAAKKYEDDFEKITIVLLEGRDELEFKKLLTPNPA
ncbi:MAG: hypothetical protein QM758_24550 [Armatimonas sp.]